jgi:single-stranded DNA-binding protein
VTGYLRNENWTAEDGTKRSKLVLTVEDWKFPDSAPKPQENQTTEEPY